MGIQGLRAFASLQLALQPLALEKIHSSLQWRFQNKIRAESPLFYSEVDLKSRSGGLYSIPGFAERAKEALFHNLTDPVVVSPTEVPKPAFLYSDVELYEVFSGRRPGSAATGGEREETIG